jgi:hydroxymethylglutaryl-CoA lyase
MLPETVRIREVGPRDGFQNEPETIATEDKVRLIEMLGAAGLKRLEVTLFVRPDVIPHLADAEEVLRQIHLPADADVTVLIPNERGLERVIDRARDHGLRAEGVISTSFGYPYEGEVPRERVFAIAERLFDAGASEIAFADTTGMANPVQVRRFFTEARWVLDDRVELTAHFHNARGQGLANVLAALEAGCSSFESSFGELGGCPVPPGATGNIATEDLVSMLHEIGITTRVNLPALLAASAAVREALGRPLGSHTLVAGRGARS